MYIQNRIRFKLTLLYYVDCVMKKRILLVCSWNVCGIKAFEKDTYGCLSSTRQGVIPTDTE